MFYTFSELKNTLTYKILNKIEASSAFAFDFYLELSALIFILFTYMPKYLINWRKQYYLLLK